MAYTVSKTIDNGIERIIYTPAEKRFQTPILMQHGMWHGAWCWQGWQELFAEWGWESIAISLPGHGKSPVQRSIRWCTLGYYLKFLREEVERLPQTPVLMGHSMGGALVQWYLRYIGDDLPAAVLVAPWTSHDMLMQVLRSLWRDPVGSILSFLTVTSSPMVRNSARAAEMFISENTTISPEELHSQLGAESSLVLLQYNRLLWSPRKNAQSPMLWFAGAADTLIPENKEHASAAFYDATYQVVPGAGHNIMMEDTHQETALHIHNWLLEQNIT